MSTLNFPIVALATDQRRTRVLDAINGPSPTKREHDLRNQLYLIASFTQLLSDGLAGAVTPRQQELLGHVLECSRKMRHLLGPARDFAMTHLPSSGVAPAAAANS